MWGACSCKKESAEFVCGVVWGIAWLHCVMLWCGCRVCCLVVLCGRGVVVLGACGVFYGVVV